MKISPVSCILDRGFFIGASTTKENANLGHRRSAFQAVKKCPYNADHSFSSVESETQLKKICYEVLVNALLKIFHHPNISILPFHERVNRVIMRWPIIWILQLGRKSTHPELKLILEKLARTTSANIIVSSLLDMIQSLQNLSLDQAEFGLVETIVITRMGAKGIIFKV